MPPKGAKKGTEPSKKTEQKQKAKVIEDKTFGLKNKKGAKGQKFVKMVHTQVTHGGNKSSREMDKIKEEQLKKKDDKKKDKEELNALFRPVVEQKVSKGADPKSVLCAFFKAGQCSKGAKCKFSHDLAIGRKAEKRSIYTDAKDAKAETMEDWDEKKLEEVVNQKHGEMNKAMPKTTIICKYFLDAVENSKYGWFWQCPNGESCHYIHALPAGFVLKKDRKRMEEMNEEISLEELIEKERAALGSQNLTKVTLVTFLKWKTKKRSEKMVKDNASMAKKKADFKAGRAIGISGRLMFEFNPDLVAGDDEDAEDSTLYMQDDDDEEQEVEQEEDGVVREINLEFLATEAQEVDDSGTQAGDRTETYENDATANGTGDYEAASNQDEESTKMDIAGALPPDDGLTAAVAAEAEIAIDENLFDGDDLDLVDEELETLELEDE